MTVGGCSLLVLLFVAMFVVCCVLLLCVACLLCLFVSCCLCIVDVVAPTRGVRCCLLLLVVGRCVLFVVCFLLWSLCFVVVCRGLLFVVGLCSRFWFLFDAVLSLSLFVVR